MCAARSADVGCESSSIRLPSGSVQNTPENLRKWIADPNSMKPGVLMPPMHLNDHDLDVITAYLTTLH